MLRLAKIKVGFVVAMLVVSCFSHAATNRVITVATEVLSLTTDQAAREFPVSITGVVTVAEPNWNGNFFVQDASGGVFVNSKAASPEPGDLVQVSGISHSGGYAPDIISKNWKKIGTAPLPDAEAVPVEQLMSGAEDGQRIEISGIVRAARQSQIVKSRLVVDIASGGSRFRAYPPASMDISPEDLVGATVRVRGTPGSRFNPSLHQVLTVFMFVPRESDFIVDKLPRKTVLQMPFTPLRGIAQYQFNRSSEPRIRVRGIVTFQRQGKDIFLHDTTGALQVQYAGTNTFAPGEAVEAIGFPGSENFLPVLEDAMLIRHEDETAKPVGPLKVSAPVLLKGFNHADLISLQGKLLDYSLGRLTASNSPSGSAKENILTLQSGNYFFTVEAPATVQFADLASIPIGSKLNISGICLLHGGGEDGKIESFKVLLPSPANIHILQRPGWWTPARLLYGLGILLAVSLAGSIFTILILRKNAALQLSISEKVKAQTELQKAHDLLEVRVQERTNQLKAEMQARVEAEVQFKAVASERTRIAQELHDTLLQGFTGVGLKLDALASTLPPTPGGAKEQLLKILEQSDEYLVEARCSVWELRSSSLEKLGDFSSALKKVSERAVQGTSVQLQFATCGDACKPPEAIEDNLLRICEEAATNAVRHARPTSVEVKLEYAPGELRLFIRDDGCGFNPQGPEASRDGHFGLVGMRERVDSIGGRLSLISQPGQGTEVSVTVRL